MKTRSFATLLFFLISLAIFLNYGLASDTSESSATAQSESTAIQPEWFWGRRPFPRGPWGRPIPRWPIPGHGGALPPLPAHKFPPLPWWGHRHPPSTKDSGSGDDVSNAEQVEIAEQADSIEQDDNYNQQAWFFHPYLPGFRRPLPGFRPRPIGFFPRPIGFPGRRPFPGWGALPPRPAHH